MHVSLSDTDPNMLILSFLSCITTDEGEATLVLDARSSSIVSGRAGSNADKGDGGEVSLVSEDIASRNWRPERYRGKAYELCYSPGFLQVHSSGQNIKISFTNLEDSFHIER